MAMDAAVSDECKLIQYCGRRQYGLHGREKQFPCAVPDYSSHTSWFRCPGSGVVAALRATKFVANEQHSGGQTRSARIRAD